MKTGGNIPESLRIFDKEALSKGVTGRERKDRTDVILRQVKSVTRGIYVPEEETKGDRKEMSSRFYINTMCSYSGCE